MMLMVVHMVETVCTDLDTILQTLTRILEQQSKMQQEYLELKRQQVELLHKTYNELRLIRKLLEELVYRRRV
jgi:ElaB/YqjD/DUF883 family membrane-anchored ribosome-binding protein